MRFLTSATSSGPSSLPTSSPASPRPAATRPSSSAAPTNTAPPPRPRLSKKGSAPKRFAPSTTPCTSPSTSGSASTSTSSAAPRHRSRPRSCRTSLGNYGRTDTSKRERLRSLTVLSRSIGASWRIASWKGLAACAAITTRGVTSATSEQRILPLPPAFCVVSGTQGAS